MNQAENIVPAKAPAWSLRILLLICAGALSVIIVIALEDVIHAAQVRQTETTQPSTNICKTVTQTLLTMPPALQMQIKAQCEMPSKENVQ